MCPVLGRFIEVSKLVLFSKWPVHDRKSCVGVKTCLKYKVEVMRFNVTMNISFVIISDSTLQALESATCDKSLGSNTRRMLNFLKNLLNYSSSLTTFETYCTRLNAEPI